MESGLHVARHGALTAFLGQSIVSQLSRVLHLGRRGQCYEEWLCGVPGIHCHTLFSLWRAVFLGSQFQEKAHTLLLWCPGGSH